MVKNGEKSLFSSALGIPFPVSSMVRDGGLEVVMSVMVPCDSIDSMAFLMILMRACSRSPKSALMKRGVLSGSNLKRMFF